MFKIRVYINILLLMICINMANAQVPDKVVDSIVKHTEWYRIKKTDNLLFAHLDKTVYLNNDVIWFTAYLLGVESKDIAKHEVLSAALINNNDQTIAAQGKFIMAGGIAYGNLTVPDTIPPGHYSFIAYTNRMVGGKPEVTFSQPLTLKTGAEAAFNVELVLDTMYKDPANIRVLLNARTKAGPLDGAAISYFLGKDKKTRIAGKAKTNVIGSYTLLVPKDHVNEAQRNLEVQVKAGKEIKTLHLDMPVKKLPADVKFYPEGGHMVAQLPNRIAWEAKTTGGTPIKTVAVVFAGTTPTDTINTDSYGMGYFYLTPALNTAYTVKLLQDNMPGNIYPLPAALKNGMTLNIRSAVVQDSLKLQLISTAQSKITLLVHNYKQVYSATQFTVTRVGRHIKINLLAIPRGLTAITVLDSLQRPCAERLFFAHYDQKPKLIIGIDSKEAALRQKVNLKLKLKSANGLPAEGLVSIACVQDNRFEARNDNNIEHYVYLQSEIDNIPLKDDLFGDTEVDRKYLNELLMVRGWSKYTWPELMKAAPADTVKQRQELLFTGAATRFDKPLKKPVQLIMLQDSAIVNFNTLASNDKGGFELANYAVYSKPGKQVKMIVSGNSSDYAIAVDDPYIAINKSIAKNMEPEIFDEPIVQNTKEFTLSGFEHATNLREVKIKAAKDNFKHGFAATNSNACGDYICRFGILNCPRHQFDIGNRAPVEGERVNAPGLGLITYHGNCQSGDTKPGMLAFEGVYSAKEFYGADYTKVSPTEPDYLSTICWKHGVRLTSGKETEISFYTSDVTGKFRIVVQGVTNQDVVYSEDSFTVKKKTAQ